MVGECEEENDFPILPSHHKEFNWVEKIWCCVRESAVRPLPDPLLKCGMPLGSLLRMNENSERTRIVSSKFLSTLQLKELHRKVETTKEIRHGAPSKPKIRLNRNWETSHKTSAFLTTHEGIFCYCEDV